MDQLTEDTYAAFAECGLPEKIDYCTYCDDEAYERALHGDVKSLPVDLVQKYVEDALHHTGDATDFLHFVPRILELMLAGELEPLGMWETTLQRFDQAGWRHWPKAKLDQVDRFIEVIWQRARRGQLANVHIEDVLIGLYEGYGDLRPFLVSWGADESPEAYLPVADLALTGNRWVVGQMLGSPSWPDDAQRQVHEWLLDGPAMSMIERALDIGGDQVVMDHFEAARRILASRPELPQAT